MRDRTLNQRNLMEKCPHVGRPCDLYMCQHHWRRALQHRDEATGEVNRYYFGLAHGREARSDEELLIYYVENGGASDFRRRELLKGIDTQKVA